MTSLMTTSLQTTQPKKASGTTEPKTASAKTEPASDSTEPTKASEATELKRASTTTVTTPLAAAGNPSEGSVTSVICRICQLTEKESGRTEHSLAGCLVEYCKHSEEGEIEQRKHIEIKNKERKKSLHDEI